MKQLITTDGVNDVNKEVGQKCFNADCLANSTHTERHRESYSTVWVKDEVQGGEEEEKKKVGGGEWKQRHSKL